MTVLNPPVAVQARADHAADDLRGALQSDMIPNGMAPRGGIMPGWGAELSVAQRGAGANMSVDVGSGCCLIPAPTAGHGGWPLLNDATVNLSIAAAHATLARIDLVIARVADAQYFTGGDGAAAIKVLTGTPAASPVAPTVPTADGAYIVLAQVSVAAAVTSITNANITLNTNATRPYTVGSGGILPVANAAARTALTAYVGLQVYQVDTGDLWTWTGSAWEGGWQTFTPALVAGGGGATVGNGTLTARYRKSGKTVSVIIILSTGSTTTFGAGGAQITGAYPVSPATVLFGKTRPMPHWTGAAADLAIGAVENASAGRFDLYSGGAGLTGAPGAGHVYMLEFTYEAA